MFVRLSILRNHYDDFQKKMEEDFGSDHSSLLKAENGRDSKNSRMKFKSGRKREWKSSKEQTKSQVRKDWHQQEGRRGVIPR